MDKRRALEVREEKTTLDLKKNKILDSSQPDGDADSVVSPELH